MPGSPRVLQVLQAGLQFVVQPNPGHQMLMLGTPRVLQVLQAGLERVLQPNRGHQLCV